MDAKITSDDKFVYIPVLTHRKVGFPIQEMEVEETPRPRNFKDILDLPPGLMERLPSSFDIIGDIFLMKLIEELIPYADDIADALLETNTNAKVVALDRGVKGEYRTRDLEILAGENRTTTVQKEYGLRYEVDVAKVYFSPRLATERKRIADLVQTGEIVMDMFCGVGPFSLMLAKTGKPKYIHAIDKNPEAIIYLKKNIIINKINNVAAHLGDARDVAAKLTKPHRIIMNLPHTAIDFLDLALDIVKPGGTIHLYLILESDSLEMIGDAINDLAVSRKRNIKSENMDEVHTYSPTQSLFCFDLVIE